MQWELAEHATPLAPREYRRLVPFGPSAASDRLGWVGLEAARYRDVPDSENDRPPLTHHALVLFDRPPDEFDLRYEGVDRHRPPAAGSVSVIPAGIPSRWRWGGSKDSLHVFLEPRLVERVAAEAFGIDPARWELPPLDRLDPPGLGAALRAVDAELSAGGAGGPLAAESLANVLAVHLIRHVSGPRRPARARDGVLPRGKLRAVIDYIEGHLDAGPTLAEMAAVARISPYHFARQFKAATGLPPHRYVIARRIERAKGILQAGGDVPLAQVAARAGFSDQSQFSHHFKRLVGVTPGRFRSPARIA
jgi:AraC family transcriptional regulator